MTSRLLSAFKSFKLPKWYLYAKFGIGLPLVIAPVLLWDYFHVQTDAVLLTFAIGFFGYAGISFVMLALLVRHVLKGVNRA